MQSLKLVNHLSLVELKRKLETETDTRLFKRWQILNAVANNPGIKAETIASYLGTTASIVKRCVRIYNKNGGDYLSNLKWGGRREERSTMSFQQEQELLKNISESSLRGEILTAKNIREKVEKLVKRPVSDDYLWDLFKRHGWKKKAPRPKHPKQNIEAQEMFKKNSRIFWQPTS